MKERLAHSNTKIAYELATWYRALPLSERITSGILYLHEQTIIPPFDIQLGRKRLQHWKEQVAFKREGLFAERLALDGLTEDDLLGLLAEPLQECISAPLKRKTGLIYDLSLLPTRCKQTIK